jgi:hypothetical protein
MKRHVNRTKRAAIATEVAACMVVVHPLIGCASSDTVAEQTATREPALAAASAIPRTAMAGSEAVGNGNDYVAHVAGNITSAKGSFFLTNNVTSVQSNNFFAKPNEWTLQLNTNRFVTPACGNSPNRANCRGWEQFVWVNNPNWRPADGILWIEYWLLDYNADATHPCPGSFWQPTDLPQHCVLDSDQSTRGSAIDVSNLSNVALHAYIANGSDNVELLVGGVRQLGFSADAAVLNLAQGWNEAEYNIFGDTGGSVALFNQDGATVGVRVEVSSGTTASPLCINNGYTGEGNNLNLEPGSCCPFGATGSTPPAIQFRETNVSPMPGSPFCLLNDITPIQFPLR